MTIDEAIHILLGMKTESIYEDEAIRIAVEHLQKDSDESADKK